MGCSGTIDSRRCGMAGTVMDSATVVVSAGVTVRGVVVPWVVVLGALVSRRCRRRPFERRLNGLGEMAVERGRGVTTGSQRKKRKEMEKRNDLKKKEKGAQSK